MKTHYTIKSLIFTFILSLLPVTTIFAQQTDDKRMKIELTLKDGKNTTSLIKSFTVSYNRTLVNADKTKGKDELSGDTKPVYLSLDFDRQDLSVLRAFTQNRSGLDGQITVTDTYGKLPLKKLEFKSAVMDLMTDQATGEYTSAYITLSSTGLSIDGVKIEP